MPGVSLAVRRLSPGMDRVGRRGNPGRARRDVERLLRCRAEPRSRHAPADRRHGRAAGGRDRAAGVR